MVWVRERGEGGGETPTNKRGDVWRVATERWCVVEGGFFDETTGAVLLGGSANRLKDHTRKSLNSSTRMLGS